MIRLNVFIQVEKSCRDKVLDIARKLTECSLKEPGCVAYDIFESSTRSEKKLVFILPYPLPFAIFVAE